MESITLASGDNNSSLPKSPRFADNKIAEEKITDQLEDENENFDQQQEIALNADDITVQSIDNNEVKLKDRISKCRNIIQSLKFELNEEKAKIENEMNQQESCTQQVPVPEVKSITAPYYDVANSEEILGDYAFSSNMYSVCVDNKLHCDENLLEYEKQLEKYQSTLYKAQMEKKHAIRKQMLTKAYRLKLLEVENQCNIELLRVKQSLQCLEPLQMIASNWNNESDADSYDLNKFELMPRFPEISANPGIELESVRAELENADASGFKDDAMSTQSE